MASPQVGSSPFLKAKGPDVPFWCGGPITFEPPPALEGYELALGVGLFLYSRYNCSRSDCEWWNVHAVTWGAAAGSRSAWVRALQLP